MTIEKVQNTAVDLSIAHSQVPRDASSRVKTFLEPFARESYMSVTEVVQPMISAVGICFC